MEWIKSPSELIERFDAALPTDPLVQRRMMFGYPVAIVNGHMFTGLHGTTMMVRLPEDLRAKLLAMEGARPFAPMANRPMKEYVVLPETIVREPVALRHWVETAFLAAASLPPKLPKSRKKSASSRTRTPKTKAER